MIIRNMTTIMIMTVQLIMIATITRIIIDNGDNEDNRPIAIRIQ